MTENEIVENTQETTVNNNNEAYIEAIKNLKANTVSREQYEQLQSENKTLLQNLVNGQTVSTETPAEPKKPISELRKELLNPDKDSSNIDLAIKVLELRQRLLDEEGYDMFVGSSHTVTPTQADYDAGERTAQRLQEWIDNSNGNRNIFIAHLEDRLVEANIPRRK